MKLFSILALFVAAVSAQERCDGQDPKTFCNTTEILTFQTSECRPYHIFIVRGSDEPYPGRQGNLSREICSRIGSNDCGFESIEYPAKSTRWGQEEWCKSAAKGATNGQAQMKVYNQRCPESKLILLGYSQGGAVAQNILSGGGGKVFECELAPNAALDTSIGSNSKQSPCLTSRPIC
jgi:acetylxylan esterase